jgi:hypothetical protein
MFIATGPSQNPAKLRRSRKELMILDDFWPARSIRAGTCRPYRVWMSLWNVVAINMALRRSFRICARKPKPGSHPRSKTGFFSWLTDKLKLELQTRSE